MNIIKTIAISLFLVLTICRTAVVAQQKSWAAMEDIRHVTALANASRLEILRQENGVTLSSRWLSFGDSLKTREISLHFVVDASMQSVLINLIQPEKHLVWNNAIRSQKLLKHEGSTWITHTIYDIPYPFSQQDLVVKNRMLEEDQKTIILLSALPDFIAPIKNINRQRHYFGKWELSPLQNGTTQVRFSALSFADSGIPRFIRDPIIQNKLFNTFIMLKKLSADEEKAVVKQLSSHSEPSYFNHALE
ncbi:MAG: hypothetical protein Q8J88_03670 [Bacteroidales bacterium]|nr:hypothetical protein [Bacteroidales bacterium]